MALVILISVSVFLSYNKLQSHAIHILAFLPLTRRHAQSNPARIVENSGVFDFVLSDKDMAGLDAMDAAKHYCWDPTAVE